MKKTMKVFMVIFISIIISNFFSEEILAIDKRSASGGDGGIYTTHTAVIKEDGSLWVWGNNANGQIGDGTTKNRLTPLHIMDDVKNVSVNPNQTAVVKKDGSFWWIGGNENGSYPGEVDNGRVGIKQFLFSIDAIYLLTNTGELYAAGGNDYGQLGNGNTYAQDEFVKVLSGVKAISAGGYHAAAIKEDNSLWLWGANEYGEVGDGTTTNRNRPVKILDNVASVSLGAGHSAAMKEDGTVWMWGLNEYCQITSNISSQAIKSPTLIFDKDDNVKKVALGYFNSAIIKKDGSLWIWGNNEYYQVGSGSYDTYVAKPTKIANDITDVTLYTGHGIAIKKDGYLYAWGNNDFGQLGDGTTIGKSTPTKIFRVAKGEQEISAKNISKTVSSAERTMSIEASSSGNGTLSYQSDNDSITVNSAGKITIKKNYIGKATITITAAETSEYKKTTKKITVTVKPVKATITSLVYDTDSIIIKIKKNIGNVKYHVQYAENAEFENAEKISNIDYNEKGYKWLEPLKNKTYYFRVRGMKKVNGTTFYGAWSDVKTVDTKILSQSITANNINKTVSSSERKIAINAKTNGNGKLTYKSDNKSITVNKSGNVIIKKNYIGKATITITAAKTEKYKKATKKITVTVNPEKATINSLGISNNRILLKNKKNVGNVKYLIEYATNSKFNNSTELPYVGYSKSGYFVVKNPKKGSTYYFRVRGVKTVNGKTFYGTWSVVKSIKIPK